MNIMQGILNEKNWQGEIYNTYINTAGELVIGASRKGTEKGIDSEDIVIYIPDFQGNGEYALEEEDAMYRESCYWDMICALGLSKDNDPINNVIIENYDANTGYLEGRFSFKTTGFKNETPRVWQLESGKFKTIIAD